MGKKSLPFFWGKVQDDERIPTPCISKQVWPNIHLQVPAQSLSIVFSTDLVPPFLSLPSFFPPPISCPPFLPVQRGATPRALLWMKRLLFSPWHLVKLWIHIYWFAFGGRKRERGVKKKKTTQSHIPWLHGDHGDMFSQWQRILTVSCLPTPLASPITPAAAVAPPSPGPLALL